MNLEMVNQETIPVKKREFNGIQIGTVTECREKCCERSKIHNSIFYLLSSLNTEIQNQIKNQTG